MDIAGNRDVVHGVHERLRDGLGHSLTVGASHWDHETEVAPETELPGPAPEFFFAPAQIAKRTKEWGPGGVQERVGEAWIDFSDWTDEWLSVRHPSGPDEVIDAYRQLLAGGVDPRRGFVATMSGRTDPRSSGPSRSSADIICIDVFRSGAQEHVGLEVRDRGERSGGLSEHGREHRVGVGAEGG